MGFFLGQTYRHFSSSLLLLIFVSLPTPADTEISTNPVGHGVFKQRFLSSQRFLARLVGFDSLVTFPWNGYRRRSGEVGVLVFSMVEKISTVESVAHGGGQ